MTFDEAIEIIWGNTLGVDASDEPGKKDFIIKDDTVATGREALTFLIRELKDIYAPTIEMTEEAYNELNDLRSHNRDLDGVLSRAMFPYNPLKWYTTEELAQAWLHPDTIKLVEQQHPL